MLFTVSMDMDRDSFAVSRLEVINTGRRRRWSVGEKRRIVEESLSGDRQASATARQHDIANSLLFKWRKAYREGRLDDGGATGFVPALFVPADGDVPSSADGGRMEIVVAGGRRVIVGADVDAPAKFGELGP